jgi:AcrR family transcriptional regulator
MLTARQARSRNTEQKILAATDRLLRRRRFDDIAMTDIAGEAGVSVGGIYARFESKEALLQALHARYETHRTEQLRRATKPTQWLGADLEERVRGIVAALVTLMREQRHVLRTFLLRYWSRPEEATGPFAETLEDLYRSAADIILEARAAISAPNPTRAVRTALAVVAGACRDIIVMKPASAPGAIDPTDEEIIETLTRAALGILQTRPKESSK